MMKYSTIAVGTKAKPLIRMINKQMNHAILGLNVHNSWIDVSGRNISFDCACQNLGPKTPNVPFPQGQGSCQGNHSRCHAGPSLVVHASHVLVKGVRCLFREGAEGEGGGLSLLKNQGVFTTKSK